MRVRGPKGIGSSNLPACTTYGRVAQLGRGNSFKNCKGKGSNPLTATIYGSIVSPTGRDVRLKPGYTVGSNPTTPTKISLDNDDGINYITIVRKTVLSIRDSSNGSGHLSDTQETKVQLFYLVPKIALDID